MTVRPTVDQNAEQRRQTREQSLVRLQPPTRIPGYEAKHFLGSGAYGEVWVAVDLNTGRPVAIKFYSHRGGLDWSLLSREVEKLTFLFSDRYVVQLLDVGWEADPPYFVMEYMPNGSLEDRLKRGPLPVEEALDIFRDIATGLVHAHGKGVLHCDLKPANILLDHDGKPRLADFGQSRLSHDQTPTLGTLFYMAPEQADLEGTPDARWDVYALGAVLYCMLVGHPPHADEHAAHEIEKPARLADRLKRYRDWIKRAPAVAVHREVPEVDRSLAEIIQRCLAPQPKARYRNAQAVLDALAERAMRKARRPLLVLGALGPALLLIVMTFFSWRVFDGAVTHSEADNTKLSLEGNRFAAQFVAETVAREIERRWQVLESIADNEEFLDVFTRGANVPLDDPARGELQDYLDYLKLRHEDLRATSWFVNNLHGVQVARSPLSSRTIERDYSFRDYFHGQARDYEQGTPDLKPIQTVHRSIVFPSQATGNRMVAFSVPIYSTNPDPDAREVIGVLAITEEVGHFAELRDESGSEKLSVLVDSRPDRDGKPGCILEHPQLAAMLRSAEKRLPTVYLDGELVESIYQLRTIRTRELEGESLDGQQWSTHALQAWYTDPFQENYSGRWLAALEPVFIKSRPTKVGDTGWAVIVQQRHDVAVTPVKKLGEDLRRTGITALGFVFGVITLLWGFVILVLNESPQSRIMKLLRRKAGLPTSSTSSASSRSSSSKASPRGNHASTSAWRPETQRPDQPHRS